MLFKNKTYEPFNILFDEIALSLIKVCSGLIFITFILSFRQSQKDQPIFGKRNMYQWIYCITRSQKTMPEM